MLLTIGTQKYTQTDRETDIKMNIETDRKTFTTFEQIWTVRNLKNRQINKQIDIKTDRHIDR